MSQERTGAVTFAGGAVTLVGPELKIGDKAPDATLLTNSLKDVQLSSYFGRVVLVSVVPSLDTGVCDAQTRRFNEEASTLGDDVVVLTVSADLPFAQKRWCGAAGIDRVETLSDHRSMSFGTAFGTYMKDLRLEARAVFVINQHGVVSYVEYVPEVTQHPNYEVAIEAAKEALQK